MMKNTALTKTAGALLAASALVNTAPALADAGDILVRGRIVHINTDADTGLIRVSGTPVANSGVDVDNDTIPELDLTYMITNNIGAELILGWSEHTVNAIGTATAGLGDVIDTKALPPTITLQYHFMPQATFSPYVGVGVNYTNFFDEEVAGVLNQAGANVKLKNSWGYALQAGFDYKLKNDWFVNLDVKYIDIDTTASFSNTSLGAVPIHVDVEIDPIVVGVGIGKRF